MPNSSRTLHPELNVEPSLKESKSCYFTNTSNKDHIKSFLSTYTENAVRTKTRRVFPQKYSNTKIFDSSESYANISTSFRKGNNSKTKYDYNSQIVTLPGGSMRNVLDIKDDKDKKPTKLNTAYSIKITQLYKSKINCLPCTGRQCETERKNSRRYKNESNDIFNKKSSNSRNDVISTIYRKNNNVNSFNVSTRREVKRQFPISRNKLFNMEHQEKVKTTYRYYKNKSQFNIL